jgi:hypothetical protein
MMPSTVHVEQAGVHDWPRPHVARGGIARIASVSWTPTSSSPSREMDMDPTGFEFARQSHSGEPVDALIAYSHDASLPANTRPW